MRSLLFVPGDSHKKLGKALTTGADALILDLEDSVALDRKAEARQVAAAFLADTRGTAGVPQLLVRINALDTGLADDDLAAVMTSRPDGIVLPKAADGRDVTHLDAKLAVHEAEAGIDDGATGIIAIATETAGALFTLGTYRGASPRLGGLSWGAEDLSAELGASAVRDDAGEWLPPYQMARCLCLAGAVHAEVVPIDTVFTDFRDGDGLAAACAAAARDGFTAKLAIHPGQVEPINRAFTPSQHAIDEATAVVEAFAAAGNPGVVALGGRMFDRPHLKRAERLLARAGTIGRTAAD